MPQFSQQSKERLSQCHSDIRAVMNEVIKRFDCTILCGYRGEKEQNEAVARGASKTPFPTSMHNKTPSLAVDVVPYPVRWPDQEKDLALSEADKNRIYYFAGQMVGIARMMGVELRWGGDWNGDTDLRDQLGHFTDLPHYELKVSL